MDIDPFIEFTGHLFLTQNCLISLSKIKTCSKQAGAELSQVRLSLDQIMLCQTQLG